MRKATERLILFVSICLLPLGTYSQAFPDPCFGPNPGTTLYYSSASCPDHHPDFTGSLVGLTNFEPVSNGFAGNWVINTPPSTATAVFAPDPNNPANLLDAGASASMIVSSTGTLDITNTVDNFNTGQFPWGSCTQTYTTACFESDIADNVDLTVDCPSQVLVVLDESGSIEADGVTATVESAVLTLASELLPSETEMAIIEFESLTRPVAINGSTAFQTVNAAFMSGLQDYLVNNVNPLPNLANGGSNPTDPDSYTPGEEPQTFIGGTNWESALTLAAGYAADIVIFITDGNPTYYNDPVFGVSGEGNVLDMTALVRARDAANLLKSTGTHLYFLGVGGNVLQQPIIEASGSDTYAIGDGVDAFCAADYSLTQFPNLTDCLVDIAAQITGKQNCFEPIPTMGEWGLLCLGLIFMILGVIAIKQESLQPSIVKD